MKRRPRRKTAYQKILIPVLVILILIGAVVGLHYLPIRAVEVKECEYVSPGRIAELVLPNEEDWNVLNGILLATVKKPVVKEVESLKVGLSGLGSFTITVKEKEAFACFPFGERWVLIDEDGRVLTVVSEQPESLFLIIGPDPDTVQELCIPEGYEEAIKGAIIYLRALRDQNLNYAVMIDEEGYFIEVGTVVVRFGDLENAKEKASALNDLLLYFQTLSGTLHLENYGEENTNGKYTFEVRTEQ